MRLPRRHIVRAAGGVVRRRRRGLLEVAVVHRPKYDDWTFPKGKLDPGESYADAALREVEEETGFRCRLGPRLGTTRYRDSKERPKVVRYWVMDLPDGAGGNAFRSNREVDELRWCTPDDAVAVLTYEHDRALVSKLGAR